MLKRMTTAGHEIPIVKAVSTNEVIKKMNIILKMKKETII